MAGVVSGQALFAVLLQAAQAAGDITRKISESGELGTQMKGENDPVTQADIDSEIMIVSTIYKYFPGVKVIGEEGVEPKPEAALSSINFAAISEEIVPASLQMIPSENLTIWVDPLDGTLSFVKKDLIGVTCLIGVALDNNPIFGVIHHTYAENMPTYYGGPEIPLRCTLDPRSSPGEPVNLSSPPDNRSCVTSKDHLGPGDIELLEGLGLTPVPLGGTGRRLLDIALGQNSVNFFPRSGSKKWDICAGDALLLSVGGNLTDMYGHRYLYDFTQEHLNKDGVLASRIPSYINEISAAMKSRLESN